MFNKTLFYRHGFNVIFTTLILLTSLINGAATADTTGDSHPIDVKAILQKADLATGANLAGVSWKINIVSTDSQGDIDEQSMHLQAVDKKWAAEFLSPLRSRGQKIVMINRNMWFSKPGLRKPVPISMRQRLSGGASNGDIASTNYAGDYTATRLDDEIINDKACYVFDLVANTKSVTYDKVKYWISQDSGLGIKAEFYSRSGKHLKTASFVYNNSITVDGKSVPFLSAMEIFDELNGDRSQFSYSDIKIERVSATAFRL